MSTAVAARNGIDNQPSQEIAQAIAGTMGQLKAIRSFVKAELKEGLDFGKIPGCGDKPTLFLPGAQKATMFFNCYPTYKIRRIMLPRDHVEFVIRCVLVSRGTKDQVGEGVGSCSTMEKKYRWRGSEKLCPTCGKPAIRKAKDDPQSGRRAEWYCWAKIGGCGGKFALNHSAIVSQGDGSPVENTDIADVYNTVLKMAKKRAHVDAAMTLGCLSELFTQDIEDIYGTDAIRDAICPDVTEIVNGDYVVNGEMIEEPAPPRPVNNNSGHGKGMYASPEQIKKFDDWIAKGCEVNNAEWQDYWHEKATAAFEEGLEVPAKIPDAINPWQAKAHLLKWAIETERLDPSIVPEDAKTRQNSQYVAIVFHRSLEDKGAIKAEMTSYIGRQKQLKSDVIYRKHPELAPLGWAEEQAEGSDKGDAWEGSEVVTSA
jgi:hypothetical protein